MNILHGFGRPWSLRRPYVYRYMCKEFVDRFFEDGSLRLSSFNQFAAHEDEQRADPEEGFCHVFHRNAEGAGQTMFSAMTFGKNAYLLCGATRYDAQLQQQFDCDSGFRINDPTAFADLIAHRLPGFTGGVEGSCHYLPCRSIGRDMGPQDLSKFKNGQEGPTQEFLDFMHACAGSDPLFIKHSSFAHQSEYRLIWFVQDAADGYIDIKCPEARELCIPFASLREELMESKRVVPFYMGYHEKLMGRAKES